MREGQNRTKRNETDLIHDKVESLMSQLNSTLYETFDPLQMQTAFRMLAIYCTSAAESTMLAEMISQHKSKARMEQRQRVLKATREKRKRENQRQQAGRITPMPWRQPGAGSQNP